MHQVRPLLLLFALTGCDDISNAIFDEDLEYLGALPTAETHEVDLERTTSSGTLPSDAPYLLKITKLISTGPNAFIDALLQIVDEIRTLPPSERGEGHRAWGPFESDAEEGSWVRLDIDRADTKSLSTWTWTFSIGETEAGPWEAFCTGTHKASGQISEGNGQIWLDWEPIARPDGALERGIYEVSYDNDAAKELTVTMTELVVDGAAIPDQLYWYYEDGEVGDFEYLADWDIWETEVGVGPETLAVRTRWIEGAGGRSDGTAFDGDLGELTYRISQCFDANGHTTWDAASSSGIPVGDGDGACAYSEWAELEQITVDW